MFYTYPEIYLPRAMEHLGDMYAYAVNAWGYTLDEFQALFLVSGTADDFANGDIELVLGMSGAELANYVLWASKLPQRKLVSGNEFYYGPGIIAGRAAALYQRLSGRSFAELHKSLPMSRIADLLYCQYNLDDHGIFEAMTEELLRVEDPECLEFIRNEEAEKENL